MAQQVQITDNSTSATVDSKVKAVKTIETEHAEIHEGETYICSHFYSLVADDANADLRIKLGSNKELHITITVAVAGDGEIFLYEDTTYTVAGTNIPIYNRDRTSSNVTDATCRYTPTVNVLGTELFHGHAPGGTKKEAIGSVRRTAQEWIFKKSGDYLVRFTNRSGGAVDASIEVEYYEVK